MKLKDKENIFLFYGDSITDGGRIRSMDGNHILGHGYQYIISAKLALDNIGSGLKFINKGNSSEGIGQLYARINQDVLVYKPDVISILVGINDVLKGIGSPLGETSKQFINTYEMMIDDIKDILPKTKIVVCEPFYLELNNSSDPYKNTPYIKCEQEFLPMHITHTPKLKKQIRKEITVMQDMLADLALKKELLYVPLQNEFTGLAKKIPPEYLIWDEIHPTVAGHEVIARKWLRAVSRSDNE